MEIRPTSDKPKTKKNKTLSYEEIFKNAVSLYRKGRYDEVANLLKEFVVDVPDSLSALKLLAFAMVEIGHLGESKRFFMRALSINRNDVEVLNAMAYLELSDGNTTAGINHLLDALFVDEDNQKLKDNLESMKNIKDAQISFSMIKPKDFLFMELPKPEMGEIIAEKLRKIFGSWLTKVALIAVIVGVIGMLIYAFYPNLSNWLENYRYSRGYGAPQYHSITIEDIDNLVSLRKKYKIKLSADEIKKEFAMIRQNIEMKRRNKAIININRLLNSNADELVKERVIFWKEFVPDPNPENLGFVPHYRDVAKAPFLYEDVYIRWNGTIANLDHKGRDETAFDLLINFVDEAVVEGIAEAHFKGFIHIINGETISLYGKIAGITLDNRVVVTGSKLSRIGNK